MRPWCLKAVVFESWRASGGHLIGSSQHQPSPTTGESHQSGAKQKPKNNMGFPGGSVVKISPAMQEPLGDSGLIPGSGRSAGKGNGNPLQYSCLGNPIEEPGGLQSTGSQRIVHDRTD